MPVKSIRTGYSPTVLIHGTADTDVPFEQSQMMTREFQKHGIAHQFHQVANGEHGLAGAARGEVDEAHRKAFEFLKLQLDQP